MASDFKWIGMAADGQSVTLKKFDGNFRIAPYSSEAWIAENQPLVGRAVGIDVETTGLQKEKCKVIELGLLTFLFSRKTGELLSVLKRYEGFEDPGAPLSAEIKRLTGITDEDVRGKKIDWNLVNQELSQADLVVAHNAQFDRGFLDGKCTSSVEALWGCSLSQVDWNAKGFNVRKLEVLSIYHGFFANAHRALHDVEAMIHLLSFPDSTNNDLPYLYELSLNASKPLVHVFAANSPFESKDVLKMRGYRWDTEKRCWHKCIPKQDQHGEISWLEGQVYGGVFRGRCEEIAPTDNFKC